GALTALAPRLATRTRGGGAAVREALLAAGAPAPTTCVLRSIVDIDEDRRAAAVFPPMLDPAIRWVVAASPCDGPDRGHQDLLLAFISVARTRPTLKLLIAGEGFEARKLRTQADLAGMLSRVVVHPVMLDQLPAVLAKAAALELAAPRATAQELARCYAAIGRAPAHQLPGIYLPEPARGLQRA